MKKKTITPHRKEWYKLDLSANVYPTLQRRNFSSVYRLSILLKEEINPEILQQAVDLCMPRFPAFKVMLRKGLFWRYFEPNNNPGPFVKSDICNPCMPMSFKAEGRYLIRFFYFQNRISLEAFHSLADGNGGMSLLVTVAAQYLRLSGHPISCSGLVLDINDVPHSEELEDAYLRYATSKMRPSRHQDKAYLVRGTSEPFYTLNIICGTLPIDQALKVAKQHNASLTEYLNAVLIYSLLEKQKSERHFREKPVKIAMPVNLRRFFPSKTLRNFITMVYPSIDPRLGDYTFEEILKQVHHYMQYYINEKFLNADITTNAVAQQNLLIRIIPLFFKDIVVKEFYRRIQDKQSSAGLTNMGVMQLPADMEEYVNHFEILMGPPFSARTNCAIISYKNILTINFASCIIETDVEKVFFRKLVKDGIPVKIKTNRNMEVL